jgi:type 1 glutamine amidotransferase
MRFALVGLLFALVWGTPAAAAAQPRVLYFSHSAGFVHESRIHAGQAITQIGLEFEPDAFHVTSTEDPAQINAANLANYDAVIFFTSGELPFNNAQKDALLQFVRSGKGFIGLHSAADTLYSWPEYGDMLGGYFQTHPWTQTVSLENQDFTHRITQDVGSGLTINDEIYQFRAWSRAAVHPLLRLNMNSVPPDDARPDRRPDNDYVLAWTKSYGAGRVFYSALGHFDAVWDDFKVRRFLKQGILWALGDTTHDEDGDTMPDEWEVRYGLSLRDATGDNGGAADLDGDGITNAQEFQFHTHPKGLLQRYLAEGATGAFFDTRIALVNTAPNAYVHAQLRFMREGEPVVSTDVLMEPNSRQTVFVDNVPGMSAASFSTLVESDNPVIVDRTMTWGNGLAYGSHAETSVPGPSTTWYFAEGSTTGRFDLFYLIQNPSRSDTAKVTASFLPSQGAAIDVEYTVPTNGRRTIHVDDLPGLAEADIAAAFTSTNGVPVIVERAMYLSRPEQVLAGGHDSAGATALSERWFLAEGATGNFFDTFILVGNPSDTPANINVTYRLDSGVVVTRPHPVPLRGRLTLNIEAEAPELMHQPVSTFVESMNGVPVVVERTMLWPGPTPDAWQEAHNTLGTTQTGSVWVLADGESGGPRNARTYVLVATGDGTESAGFQIDVYLESGPPLQRSYPAGYLLPNRRYTFDIEAEFPQVAGRRFGVRLESLGTMTTAPLPIVVERAMYSDANGMFWAAGSNVVGTRIQ